jgi:hypothetical protein
VCGLNLALSNCHLFPALKDYISGHEHQSDGDVRTPVIFWSQLQHMDDKTNASVVVRTTLKNEVAVIKLHV